MEKRLLKSINKRLEVMITLFMRANVEKLEVSKQKDQIKLLHGLGLCPKEISAILGRSNIYVNKEISKLRSEARKVKE